MAWPCEMVLITRYLIDDVNSSTYSDERLETTILVSAQLVNSELIFANTYTISVQGGSISPDPTDPKDDNFINLVCLKTACMILGSELKTKGLSAVRVTDGPSTIDMTNSTKDLSSLYKEMCSKYESAKFNFQANGITGHAILSPYSPGSDVAYRGYY